MAKLTKKMIKNYVENPNICPFCKSINISADNFEAGYN